MVRQYTNFGVNKIKVAGYWFRDTRYLIRRLEVLAFF